MVVDSAVNGGKGSVSDGEDAILDDVALLLGDDAADSCGAESRDGLQAVIAARDTGGDEVGDRWLERDVAELDALEQLVLLPFVVDRDVVRAVEFTLGVVVDVDVNAVGDDSAGFGVELEVEEWKEAALAVEHRLDESAHRAALVEISLRPQLHFRIELQGQIGMLGDDVTRLGGDLSLGFVLGLRRERRWLLRGCEARGGDLTPDCLHDRPHVLLECSRAGGFDLFDSPPVCFALGSRQHGWQAYGDRIARTPESDPGWRRHGPDRGIGRILGREARWRAHGQQERP